MKTLLIFSTNENDVAIIKDFDINEIEKLKSGVMVEKTFNYYAEQVIPSFENYGQHIPLNKPIKTHCVKIIKENNIEAIIFCYKNTQTVKSDYVKDLQFLNDNVTISQKQIVTEHNNGFDDRITQGKDNQGNSIDREQWNATNGNGRDGSGSGFGNLSNQTGIDGKDSGTSKEYANFITNGNQLQADNAQGTIYNAKFEDKRNRMVGKSNNSESLFDANDKQMQRAISIQYARNRFTERIDDILQSESLKGTCDSVLRDFIGKTGTSNLRSGSGIKDNSQRFDRENQQSRQERRDFQSNTESAKSEYSGDDKQQNSINDGFYTGNDGTLDEKRGQSTQNVENVNTDGGYNQEIADSGNEFPDNLSSNQPRNSGSNDTKQQEEISDNKDIPQGIGNIHTNSEIIGETLQSVRQNGLNESIQQENNEQSDTSSGINGISNSSIGEENSTNQTNNNSIESTIQAVDRGGMGISNAEQQGINPNELGKLQETSKGMGTGTGENDVQGGNAHQNGNSTEKQETIIWGGPNATQVGLDESNKSQTQSSDSFQTNTSNIVTNEDSGFKTFSEFEFFNVNNPDGIEYKGEIDFNLSHDERINANIAAIKLTQHIFNENRNFATKEEQEVLAKFSGFGGLRKLFYDSKYQFQNDELLALVGKKIHKELKESSFNAYYTPKEIIKNMFDYFHTFGVTENNRIRALEPSCGIGHFITLAPDNFYFEAVEKDTLTATIAKFLHPKARIYNKGFEEVSFDGKEFDIVIGNPPYENEREDKELIHNYFVLKSQSLLKDGGLSSFVITSGFMDSKSNSHRKKIVEDNDLIFAMRLSNDAFSNTHTEVLSDIVFFRKNKNRKDFLKNNGYLAGIFDRNNDLFLRSNEWLKKYDIDDEFPILKDLEDNQVKMNHYFACYPKHILGKAYIGNNQYGKILKVSKTDSIYKLQFNLDMYEHNWETFVDLNTIYNQQPGSWIVERYINDLQMPTDKTAYLSNLRIGNIFENNGNFYRKENNLSYSEVYFEDEMEIKNKHILENKNFEIIEQKKSKLLYKNPLNSKEKEILKKVIEFRDLLKENIEFEQILRNDDESNEKIMKQKEKLKVLRNDILQLSNSKGFNQSRQKQEKDNDGIIIQHNLKNIINLETLESYRIFASENVKETIKAGKKEITYNESDILQKRILYPLEKQEAKDATEAFQFTINDKGKLDFDTLQSYLPNKNLKDILEELCNKLLIFPNLKTQDSYVLKDDFISGNIKAKAKFIEQMIEKEEEFNLLPFALKPHTYLKILKDNFPQYITFDKLEISFGANFVDIDIYEAFIKESFFKEPEKIKFEINRIGSDYVISDFRIDTEKTIDTNETFTNKFDIYDESNHLTEDAWNMQIKTESPEYTECYYKKFVFDFRELIERIINNKSLEVSYQVPDIDSFGKEIKRKKVDNIASKNAIDSAERIKTIFEDYIFRNEKYRNRIEKQYNEQINVFSNNKTEFENILTMPYLNNDINLRPHQTNAVFKGILKNSLLLDHQVGAGKTLCAISIVMEQKRMGLVNKALILVPNHLSVQWGNEFLRAYPSAKLLVGDKIKSKKDRKEFLYRARNGDYDAIIMKHSTFENISVMESFELNMIQNQIDIFKNYLVKEKTSKGSKEISRNAQQLIDKKIKRLEKKLENKAKGKIFDDEIAFEDLGIDCLVVDEAHEFKNLFIETTQSNVKGLPNTDSAKAMKMFCATQYMHNNNYKLYFLTGTPVSNTIAEFYTMQRFIQPDILKELKVEHYDDWQKVFARVVLSEELDSSGINYALVNRLSKFVNAPELMNFYKQNADVISNEDIEKQVGRIVPKVKNDKAINVISPRSEDIANFIGIEDEYGKYNEGSIIWRMEHWKDDPIKNNVLACTTEARKAALDFRLINPNAFDYSQSKLNNLAQYVLYHYNDKQYEKGTQLIFCDLGVSKINSQKIDVEADDKMQYESIDDIAKKLELDFIVDKDDNGDEIESYWVSYKKDENGNFITKKDKDGNENKIVDKKYSWFDLQDKQSKFNVYAEILKKLVKLGIPQKEIAFIGDANNEAQKATLFRKVNDGDVRILIGSTSKMGVGTNVQERIVAFHEIDCPWRPCDLEQRAGRAIRQGNMFFEADKENFEIAHYRYATEQTYDSRMFQINEQKLLPLSQMKKVNNLDSERIFDAIDMEMANVAEMKAIATGNPFILEEHKIKNLLDTEKKKFQAFRSKILNYERALPKEKDYKNYLENSLIALEEIEKNNIFLQDNFEFEAFGIKTNKKIQNDIDKQNRIEVEKKLHKIEINPDDFSNQKIEVLSVNGFKLFLDVKQYSISYSGDIIYNVTGIIETPNQKQYDRFSNLKWKISKYKNIDYEKQLKLDGILTRLKNNCEKIVEYKKDITKNIESIKSTIEAKEKFLKNNDDTKYNRRILLETLEQDIRNMNEIKKIRNEKIKEGIKINLESPEIKDYLPKYKMLIDEKGNLISENKAKKTLEANKTAILEEKKIIAQLENMDKNKEEKENLKKEIEKAKIASNSENEEQPIKFSNRAAMMMRNSVRNGKMLEPNTIKINLKEFSVKEPLEVKAKILEENDKQISMEMRGKRAKDILGPTMPRNSLKDKNINI